MIVQYSDHCLLLLLYFSIDVDECEEDISGCSQTCNNSIGLFTCGCQEGYFLSDDEKSCISKHVVANILKGTTKQHVFY